MITSLETLTWSDDFKTGIDIIDEQHQRLFEYFAEIQSAIAEEDEGKVEAVCRGLIDYAVSHNTFEETLMQSADYPHFEAHQAVHHAFRERAYGYLERLEQEENRMKVARTIRTEIGLWLINHIKREDQHYVPYVKRSLDRGFVARMLKRFF
ncbi:MAG: bacteriohemerythrin [Gammaproteobacteria bacterium]|jgi:hemerythrin|nr:bacteriohemerythrin [Gammaproteobacteria bacterium]